MSEKSTLSKIADALMGEKKPNPLTQYVNPEPPKTPQKQPVPKKMITTGVRG